MLSEVTDLPDPDSPTMASTSPRWTSKLSPSTALTIAGLGVEGRAQVAHRQQRPLGRSERVSAPSSPHLRVERVAQAVADEHEAEHGQEDGEAGEEQHVGALVSDPFASATISPHAGVGDVGPTPMNDSAASDRIAAPMAIVP